MKENWSAIFRLVLNNEGGFSNHPKDPGGMTNLGVTRKNLEDYLRRLVSEEEMRSLTPDKVENFYKSRYWNKIWGDDLPSGVDYTLYDFAVNSGPTMAIRVAQDIAGTVVDGIMGPKSLAAIKAVPESEMIDAINMDRLLFLKRLPTWNTFGKGWYKRVTLVEAKSLSMVKTA